MPLYVYYIGMSNTKEDTSGMVGLPTAEGKKFSRRKKWNIYKSHTTGKHYYHLKPFTLDDMLVEENVNPDRGTDIVNAYNEEDEEDGKSKKQQ